MLDFDQSVVTVADGHFSREREAASSPRPPRLECRRIRREFGRGRAAVIALHDVSLSLVRGECCAIVGPSGSGKTTLLSILGCLLTPTRGEVLLDGQNISYGRQKDLTRLRRRSIGYVFQQAHLLPFLTVKENLTIVGRNAAIESSALDRRIVELSCQLEIDQRLSTRSDALSGGERQRAAVARALLNGPQLVLADEPTGALDDEQGRKVTELLTEQVRNSQASLVVVTHDQRILHLFDRVVRIESGRMIP